MRKYVMLAVATVFMLNVAIMAQDQRPPQERKNERKELKRGERHQMSAQKRAALMAIDLGLTDAEKVKVQALMEKQDALREQHQKDEKKLMDSRKAQFETERKAHDAELEQIIGKEKFQKFEKNRAEMHERMMNRREGMRNDSTHNGKKHLGEGKKMKAECSGK